MFTNVTVNGLTFVVANFVPCESGFKVIGITANNTAEEVFVNFSNDFGVTFQSAKSGKRNTAANATMTVNVAVKRGPGRPKGSKNTNNAESAAPVEEIQVAPKRGRGRPRKVVVTE